MDAAFAKKRKLENGNGHADAEAPIPESSVILGKYVPTTQADKPNDKDGNNTILFSVKEEVGSLARCLKIFSKHGINLQHIESRPCKADQTKYEFIVECDNSAMNVSEACKSLREFVTDLKVLTRDRLLSDSGSEVPWFPRKMRDLDRFANHILSYGHELDSDHPGFTDEVYKARRKEFADIAYNYKHGTPIPEVRYTEDETATWAAVFKELTKLYPTHACKQFNHVFPLLIENCGYREDNIPQLQKISDFLKDCTGFTLRPVAGLLSSRDFLAGLAFRVFHSTQYIRHSSRPLYTPEPDVCHELLGHVPLFADPAFAQFSQEIGLLSLGASDEYILKLATLYWFTVEFGLCRQDGKLKAFGAGLLSSFGELKYCLSDKPVVKEFIPEDTCTQEYPITQYQPIYFVASSFEDAKIKLKTWAERIERPFEVKYNAYTQSIEVLEDKHQILDLLRDVKGDITLLEGALRKVIQ